MSPGATTDGVILFILTKKLTTFLVIASESDHIFSRNLLPGG